jgi:hypothetical protein
VKSPILGQSYVARSVNAADNRMINLFPEATPEAGKSAGFLNRAPGLRLLATVGTGPVRGLWAHGGEAYVVSGSQFYKLNSAYVATLIGSVSGTGPVSMADNGTQLFIACNPDGYVYEMNTGAFGQITDVDFAGAQAVSYIDGYFVYNQPNSQIFWITSILGTSIDPLDFASAEGSPDGLVTLIVDHRELWLFGTDSVEVWYNSGNATFPFERIQGAFNEIGCEAPYSVAKLDNGIFWLGSDTRGNGIVYRANGYTGQRVSTHAVEFAIQGYADLSDAVAYTYQQEGHAFYVLIFPSAGATWVYDVATNSWTERAGFANGAFTRHRSNCQMNFNGEIVVGDYANGNVYAFDLDVYADNGAAQKWLRSWRALPSDTNDLKRTTQHCLQLDCETGVGLATGQGSDPQVALRWSDDGGHTWSSEHWRSMGAIGQFGRRTIWRRLGMTTKIRDRVYEISGTDPVKIAIVGAELSVTATNG